MKRKKYLIDLCCGWNDCISQLDDEMQEELKEAIDSMFEGSLDELTFTKQDVDRRFYILDDGGESIVLKNGDIYNVCFRGSRCRVWKEEDNEFLIGLVKGLREG